MRVPAPAIYNWRAFLAIAAASWLVLLLPRIAPLSAGYAMWEDWGTNPVAHLESYRPVAALELALMQAIFGEGYLHSLAARVVGAAYLAIGFSLLLALQSDLGARRTPLCVLAAAVSLHPMFNEFLLWGVLSSFWLAFVLVAVGSRFVTSGRRVWVRLVGLVLIGLAGGLYQLATFLPVCIVVAEVAARGVRKMAGLPRDEVLWRLSMMVVAPLVGLSSLLILRHGFGYVDFDARGISLADGGAASWISDKFHVLSNAFANTYQAPIAEVFGRATAVSLFWPMVATAILACLAIGLLSGGSAPDRVFRSSAVSIAFFACLTPLLIADATPTGFRVIAFATFGVLIVAGPVLSLVRLNSVGWAVGCVGLFVIAAAFWRSSSLDLDVRLDSFERDIFFREELKTVVQDRSIRDLTVCASELASQQVDKTGRGILVSYNPATESTYSNVIRFPTLFLAEDYLGVDRVRFVDSRSQACASRHRGGADLLQLDAGELEVDKESGAARLALRGWTDVAGGRVQHSDYPAMAR
jgi:hypothetical protein